MTPDATVLSAQGASHGRDALVQMIELELCDSGPAARTAPPQAPVAIARHALFEPLVPPPSGDEPGPARLPGSNGEHLLQCAYGTRDRAKRFYADQVLDRLNQAMIEFIARMELLFVATADANGECDASLRAGPPGFIQVLGPGELAYPEYRGNGVLASLGNIAENGHVGLLMIDFVTDLIGLHVNGRAQVVAEHELRRRCPGLPSDHERGRRPERWVLVEVQEAYIHCRKHIPRMVPVSAERAWGTDDVRSKGGDYFGARATPTPWSAPDRVTRWQPVPAGIGQN